MGKVKHWATILGALPSAAGGDSTSRQGSNAQVTGAASSPSLDVDAEWIDWRRYMALARRARASGALQRGPVLHWSTSGGSQQPCENPILRAFLKAAEKGPVWDLRIDRAVSGLAVYVRCRTCRSCLEHRRRLWVARTLAERAGCPGRVWFVTLTSNPDHREFVRRSAAVLAYRDRKQLDRLAPEAAYPYLARVYKREISLFMKRLRHGVGKLHQPKLRFMAVREPHSDWFPHAHLLIFEWDPDHGITKRLLEARWSSRGFTAPRLASGKAILYVAKYIGKSQWGLPHASIHWGRGASQGARGGR